MGWAMAGKSIMRRYNDAALRRHSGLINGRVLDLGAGNYDNSRFFNCNEYVRLDIDKGCMPDLVSTVHSVALRGNSFDAIICSNLLEHIPEPKKAAREMHRLLKPNGVLLASVPFVCQIHPNPKDMQRFTPEGLQHVFADFSVETIEHFGGYFSVLAVLLDDFFNVFIGRNASAIFYGLGKTLDSIHILPEQKRDPRALGKVYSVGFMAVCRKAPKK